MGIGEEVNKEGEEEGEDGEEVNEGVCRAHGRRKGARLTQLTRTRECAGSSHAWAGTIYAGERMSAKGMTV
jgi:hypothetical protein